MGQLGGLWASQQGLRANKQGLRAGGGEGCMDKQMDGLMDCLPIK